MQLRRGVPIRSTDLGHLDPEVVLRVAAQARPELRDAEELHDLLHALVLVEPEPMWATFFERLVADGRACEALLPTAGGAAVGVVASDDQPARWAAAERCAQIRALVPGTTFRPGEPLVASTAVGALGGTAGVADRDAGTAADTAGTAGTPAEEVLVEAVRGHLEVNQPLTADELALRTGIGTSRVAEVRSAIARLVGEGSVLECHVGDDPAERYPPAIC